MKRLVDTEEAARVLNITQRTVRRWFEAGRIEGEFVDSGKGYGKGGMVLKVWIPEGGDTETPRRGDAEEKPKSKNRYRVFPGEPGCHIVTPMKAGMPVISHPHPIPLPEGEGNFLVQDDKNLKALPLAPPSPADPLGGTSGGSATSNPTANLPQPLLLKGTINPKALRVAHLRYALISAFQEEIKKNHKPKQEIIRNFLDIYNAKLLLPNIHDEIGTIGRSTLYNWLSAYDIDGIKGLQPATSKSSGLTKIAPAETQFLRQFLLNQNRRKIADAIRKCKYLLGDQSPSSPATLRRYVNAFKKEYHDVWTLEREGQKAWNDKCAPYATRAWWTLNVGEILVADGHKLNFMVINPHTGKPCRAVLVMFWDWYSSYPVGWEVMLTENVQCVATALRNAIIHMGKTPECVLLDNGKAFKARCFTKKIVLEETEIPGMFARLGIDTMFAMKYNAQSKPIERIFGVLEWLERELESFSGASINDKPANLLPNEPRAKRLRGDYTPKLDQVNDLIRQWRDFYVVQPLRGRSNKTAQELFDPGRGAGVDPKALCFLMMKAEVKGVRRERLTFDGFDYAGDCLYGLKSRVLVRYSLSDRGQVYVFDLQEKFIGMVTPVVATAPRDHAAARRIISERNRALRQTKALSTMARTASPETIDLLSRKAPGLIEYIQSEETKKEKPKLSPFIRDEENTGKMPVPPPKDTPVPPDRPFFHTDYDKFMWLINRSFIAPKDQTWLDSLMEGDPIYKEAYRQYKGDA